MPLVNPPPNIISGSTPMKVGGTPSPGSSAFASAYNHVHGLIETSGPTNLNLAGIFDDEIVRRVGANLVGRALQVGSLPGDASTSVVTASDVGPELTFSLLAGRTYVVLWLFQYATAAATTGIMMAVNYTGTASGARYGVLMSTGANTIFSQGSGSAAWDSLFGTPSVGPGGTGRVGLMYVRLTATTAGVIALRYASGVAASAVTMKSQSVGIALQA